MLYQYFLFRSIIKHVQAQKEPDQEIEIMQAMATLPMDAHAGPGLMSFECEPSSFASETELEPLSIRESGNCIQGFLVGLCLEGVFALCIYSVYHVVHIVR